MKPWARVSWISRVSRSRSASAPCAADSRATSSRLASSSAISRARSVLCCRTMMIQLPMSREKAQETAAKSELKNRSPESGRSTSAHTTTGTILITVTANSALRIRSSMKHCGVSAKMAIRVSPTSAEGTTNSRNSPTR
ncbi:hypothetical protein [Streptomyces rapamycinicus]|uniref:hypothetical protein n=1 Tax=Streptomyces rapamycinicus TaxID=1226757 RepID=UPI0032D90416